MQDDVGRHSGWPKNAVLIICQQLPLLHHDGLSSRLSTILLTLNQVLSCYLHAVAAICHKSWRIHPPLSLRQSSFVPFPLLDSLGGLGRARSPVVKHFDAVYTVNIRCTLTHWERERDGHVGSAEVGG